MAQQETAVGQLQQALANAQAALDILRQVRDQVCGTQPPMPPSIDSVDADLDMGEPR